jgi:hypothetical protein
VFVRMKPTSLSWSEPMVTKRPIWTSLQASIKPPARNRKRNHTNSPVPPLFRSGSEAAKVTLLERIAAFSQKAEPNQACFSVLFCSEFGQKQLYTESIFFQLQGFQSAKTGHKHLIVSGTPYSPASLSKSMFSR